MSGRLRSLVLAGSLVATLGVAGCYSPSGGLMPRTNGAQTYVSTETRPVSIVILDLRSDEVIFEQHVQPGRQLTLQFFPDEGDDSVYTPDLMKYMIFDAGTSTGRLRNALSVPPASSRRIDVYYRDDVEYRPMPPEEAYRVDEPADRPSWWTPEGGPMPEGDPVVENYDD